MSGLTREDVLKLAKLSRLRLSDEEIEKYQAELSELIEYVEQLKNVDTDELEPTNQVTGLKNVWREDEIKDYGFTQDDLLKNAPATEGKLLKVKRMLQ